MACRTAHSLVALKKEMKAVFPNRDAASDGGCASPDHSAQNPNSDHEPNAAGVARAYDYDSDLRPGQPRAEMFTIAEHLRRLGEYGDHRLVGGARNGYIIFFGKIAGAGKGWHWRTYTGPNTHKSHMHVSVCSNPAGYDDGASPWHIADLFRTPPQQPPAGGKDMLGPRFSDKTGQDQSQLVNIDGVMYVIDEGDTAAALEAEPHKVPVIAIGHTDYAQMKAKANS